MTKTVNPVVSVCVPTYNGADYLEECLDSILSQTLADIEVLVVDDCSTDETFSIAKRYSRLDSRVNAIQNTGNVGLPNNWNVCAQMVRGAWVKFVFQDDLLQPDCLERMIAAADSDCQIICCKRKIILTDDSAAYHDKFQRGLRWFNMDRIFPGKSAIPATDFCNAVIDNWLWNFIGEPTAVLLRRGVFSRFGFFHQHLIQICDFEYWIRVASHTGLIYLSEPLATFRFHGKSASIQNITSRKFRMHLDQLVCTHEFLFQPVHRPIRDCAAHHNPPLNLQQWFASGVSEAYKEAKAGARIGLDPNPFEDLREISLLFPGFKMIKKLPLSLTATHYKWKMLQMLKARSTRLK